MNHSTLMIDHNLVVLLSIHFKAEFAFPVHSLRMLDHKIVKHNQIFATITPNRSHRLNGEEQAGENFIKTAQQMMSFFRTVYVLHEAHTDIADR